MTLSDGLFLGSAALNALCLLYRIKRRKRITLEHRIVTFLLINLFFTSVFELSKDLVASFNALFSPAYDNFETTVYFLLHNCMAPLFAFYIMRINGAAKIRSGRYYFTFFIPAAVAQLFTISNPFTHVIFYIDSAGNYLRNAGIIIPYLSGAVYLVYSFVTLKKTWDILRNRYMSGFHGFMIVVVAGILIQAFFQEIQIECLFQAFALVGIMLTIDCNEGLVDNITGLPNGEYYKINISLFNAYNYRYSIINIRFLNLGYFQKLMSRSEGENLLWSLSNTIVDIAPKCEVYRYDEDAFVVVVPYRIDASKTASEYMEVLSRPMYSDSFIIDLRSVISVAKIPEDMRSVGAHIRLAEYRPESGSSFLTVLAGKDLEFLKREVDIEKAVQKAILNKSFMVYYQPIWDRSTGSIVSCEALCRLVDDELGVISPGEFIPVAEKDGNIVNVGDIVFEIVCRDIREKDFESIGIETVEVNLSPYQLRAKGLLERFKDSMERYGVRASQLNLEITETASAADSPDYRKMINDLNDMGFTVSLDDYGTGYSNLANVINANYTNIKIDASILWNSDKNAASRDLLILTISAFRDFGNNVIQEGVETKEQLDFVTEAGANLIQGYYFSRPVPVDEFVEYVRRFNKGKGKAAEG